MINPIKIGQCLAGLVAFQFENVKNKDSASGVFVDMMHPLISFANIQSSIEMNADMDAYLEKKYRQGAVQLANELYVYKNLNGHSKTLLTDAQLYHGSGNVTNFIENKERFIGFRINLKERDVALTIRKIGFQLEGDESFKLYLYHSSQNEALQTWDVLHNKPFSFQWSEISQVLMTKLREDSDSGVYYLGYYQSDLTQRAINKQIVVKSAPCTCDAVNFSTWKKWSGYFDIVPFYVEKTHLNEYRSIWDILFEVQVPESNFGINLMFNIQCDTTDVFCMNKNVLASALALKIAVGIVEDMANSLRNNQNNVRLVQLANYALNNKENGTDGLYSKMQKEIQKVSFNFSDISSKCLPCDASGFDISVSSVY